MKNLDLFLVTLAADTAVRYQRELPRLTPPTFEAEPGLKYVRIVEVDGPGYGGRHSKYFVRKTDGAIFACSSWKKPNFNRQFGTLYTIGQFEWGNYEGRANPGSDFVMVKTSGQYATAVPLAVFGLTAAMVPVV